MISVHDLPPPTPSRAALAVLMSDGLRSILAERIEQIDVHGFTPAHDAGHHPATLANAAVSYLNEAADQLVLRATDPSRVPLSWPFEPGAWSPGDARANLVKAVAIAWAVIDRIDAGEADAVRADIADILETPLAGRVEA